MMPDEQGLVPHIGKSRIIQMPCGSTVRWFNSYQNRSIHGFGERNRANNQPRQESGPRYWKALGKRRKEQILPVCVGLPERLIPCNPTETKNEDFFWASLLAVSPWGASNASDDCDIWSYPFRQKKSQNIISGYRWSFPSEIPNGHLALGAIFFSLSAFEFNQNTRAFETPLTSRIWCVVLLFKTTWVFGSSWLTQRCLDNNNSKIRLFYLLVVAYWYMIASSFSNPFINGNFAAPWTTFPFSDCDHERNT